MGKRRRRLLFITVSLLASVWVVGVGLTFLNEGRTPPDSALPDVPGPAVVTGISTQCGSGGCYREMVIEAGSTMVANELVNEMDLSQERCSARNPLTVTRICTGSSYTGGELRVYVRYAY